MERGAIALLLDTDIGTDVDDALALGVCLGSPEIELAGITTVYGDVGLRAAMVRELFARRDRPVPPLRAGASEPLDSRRPVLWGGHEGHGLLDEPAAAGPVPRGTAGGQDDAATFLARCARERPGELHLVAIGPLTNVARAVLADPAFVGNLAGLTVMGGVLRGPDGLALPLVEHNLRCDPEAAEVVFTAGAPVRLVPLDVTTRVAIDATTVAALAASPDEFHRAVARLVEHDPRYRARGRALLHDPLALATVIRPDLVRWQDVHVEIETAGHYPGQSLMRSPSSSRPANASVALDVDVAAAEAFVVQRLLR